MTGWRRASIPRLWRVARGLMSAEHLGYAAIQSVLLQILTVLANLATGVITARLLGASGRGYYAAAVTWPSMLGMAAAAGTADAVLVHLRRAPDEKAATLLWGGLVTLVASTLLSGAAWILMPTLLGAPQHEALPIARAALVLTYFVGFGALVRQAFAGRSQFRLTNVAAFLPHLIHAVVLVGFAAAGALTVETAVLSLLIGLIASQVLLLPAIVRDFRGSLVGARRAIAAVNDFARRAAPGDLMALLPNWADRLVLILLLTPRELGFYTMAYGFSRVVTVAAPASGLLLSAMSGQDLAVAKRLHDVAIRFCIASLGLTVGVAFALSHWLIHLFYGAEFLPAAPIFQLLVLQAVGGRVAAITAQLYLAANRPALTSAFEFIGVVVSATLIVILAPVYGPIGAAAGLLGGTGVRLALLWGGLVVQLGVPLPRLWLSFEDLRSAKLMFKA
jgi:O-antigen/teichoic acid export membrane protein